MSRLAVAVVLSFAFVTGSALAKDYKVEISDLKYNPAKLKIKKGDKVIWTNKDDRDHTVVCKGKGKEKDAKDSKDKDATTFDSGKIASGDKFEFTFKKAGKFEYGCDYHPRMKGVVEVTD